MSTNREILTLSLADLDRFLPSEYLVLSPFDAGNETMHSLRAVRNEASGQTYSFSSAQEYLQFIVSVAPRSILAEERGTRYLLLSAQYDADPWFHASVTHTVADLTHASVILHRMKSDETSVRFALLPGGNDRAHRGLPGLCG